MEKATLPKRECLLIAVVLVAAFHAIPWWAFNFLPSRAIYDRLGQQGYATLYDAITGVMPFLLCLGSPLRSGLTLGRWQGRTLMVIGICVLVTLDGKGLCEHARIALAGLADGTQRAAAGEAALIGSEGDPASVDAAMSKIAEAADTHSDMSADAEYRKNLIRTLGREVGATAFERARALGTSE